ncbi:MAG: efflux RND transporter periplasmic adaptor subunit [Bacteroidia bacterium]|nr:efflux RND transporter periplasmic adaptor subunit [Bacteroidia bacterium]
MIKTVVRWLIAVVVLGGVGYTFYFIYQKSQPKEEVFQTEEPFIATIVKKTVATGSIVPQREITIKSRVSGILEEIYVEAGQSVKQGQTIARIRIIPNAANLGQAESAVERAKIAVKDAEQEYKRQKGLFDQQVIAASELQPSKLKLDLANQELEAAENNLQVVKEGSSKKASTNSTIVVSTATGTVLDVPVKKGASIIESNNFNEGTTIATIADMNSLMFKGNLDESEVGKIKEGLPIQIQIAALPDKSIPARLDYISPKGMDVNGAIQFEIKAFLKPNKDNIIRAGYSANADIVLAQKDSVLCLKESTIKQEGDKRFTEVLVNGKFEKRMLRCGISDDINTEILEGIKKGEKVKSAKLETN